ncbi:uncharacterized protein METZ01_LOCUS219472 [marine metagenome]|uniref:Uncharacterized protein n=1 Tax=marine metagenome TaxID=408172 RepID=A0A382FU65_9ZZZZ
MVNSFLKNGVFSLLHTRKGLCERSTGFATMLNQTALCEALYSGI